MASDLITTIKEILRAAPAYEKAERYWAGTANEVFSDPNVHDILGANASKFKVNIARRPITALMDRLELDSVAVEDDDPADTDDTPDRAEISPLQAELDKAWRDLELDLEVPEAIAKALRYGDAYLALGKDRREELVSYVRTPFKLRAFYDDDNPKELRWFGSTWLDDEKYRRVTLWYLDRTEHYISKSPDLSSDRLVDDEFRPYTPDPNDPDSWIEEVDDDTPRWPFYHLRTERPYGRPMHEVVYGVQNMLTKQLAVLMDATDGYGLPFRYAIRKLGSLGQRATAQDDWDTPGGPAVPEGPKVKTKAGQLAQLDGIDAIGQLQPADINNLLEPIDMFMRLGAVVSDVSLNYFDPSADVSGVSRREDEKPFVKKVERLQTLFEGVLERYLQDVLALRGAGDTTVRITWAPAELVDEGERWAIVKAKCDAGMPLRQALIEAGYVDKAVDQFLAESGEQAYSTRVELWLKLSQLASNFGAASNLGIIDEKTVQLILRELAAGLLDEDARAELERAPTPVIEPRDDDAAAAAEL